MKVLIYGSSGFIGNAVYTKLSENHEVYGANKTSEQGLSVDLTDKNSIAISLKKIKPEVIINCAGVVENSELAELNYVFTKNILEEITKTGLQINKVIICGSAAEYGIIDKKNIPTGESTPLNPNSLYGQSKVKEISFAIDYQIKHKLPVVVPRIFNPIGSGMHPRFIIPGIIRQIKEIKAGHKNVIEVSRLDSRRDYINISDIASAIDLLAESDTSEIIYNVGSGTSTSNGELIDLLVKYSGLTLHPQIVETVNEKEPLLAIQANISRIRNEFGWRPQKSVEETIKEVING